MPIKILYTWHTADSRDDEARGVGVDIEIKNKSKPTNEVLKRMGRFHIAFVATLRKYLRSTPD